MGIVYLTLNGWNGQILWVDLSEEKVSTQKLDADIYKKFIGGKGLGTYLLYKNLEAGVDPLGPENILFFMTGPLQGLPAPNVGRWTLVTKSPLSGLFLDSHCGGALGREIKKAGYDALCVKGKSKTPIYLRIHDDDVTIESADHLWGTDIHTSTKLLHDEIELVSSMLDKKIIWNKFESLQIMLYESGNEYAEDEYNKKLVKEGPRHLITLNYYWNGSKFIKK